MSNQQTATLPLAPRRPLKAIKAARVDAPWIVLIHGMGGIGKTTFASEMPSPIFICAETHGADELEVARYPEPLSTFADLRTALRRLTEEEHDFKTLVIDTIDELQALVFAEVVRKDRKGVSNIEEVGGGFYKGYNLAVEEWRLFASDIERLVAKRGMNVCLIAHTVRRKINDPTVDPYDQWQPNIHQYSCDFLYGWCKTVLFAHEELITQKKGAGKVRASSTGVRVIRTKGLPPYMAKNRQSLPDPMPLDYGTFAEAMKVQQVAPPEKLLADIKEKLAQLADEAMTAKIWPHVEAAKDDAVTLAKYDNRMTQLLREKKGADTDE